MTLAIISILFVAVAAGLTTSVKAGAATDQQQRLQAKLTSFTEGLRSLTYEPCGTAGDWNNAYDDASNDALWRPDGTTQTATVLSVSYWNGTAFDASSCVNDPGSQLLSVEVTDGNRNAKADVVVRK